MFDTVMHWIGFGLCHQLPARSFVAAGHQLPVCARDTGIYIGFMVSVAVMALLDRRRHRSGLPPMWLMAIGVALVAAMGWDGVTEYAGLRATTNLIRLATGLGTGFALALVVVPILNAELWRSNGAGRVLGSVREGAIWLVALPVTFAATYWGAPHLGIVYPALVAACVLGTFATVNLVIVSMVPAFERRAERARDLVPAIGVALLVTAAELAGAAALRLALLRLLTRG